MESIVILLTGTIKVSNTPNLKFSNLEAREEEYYKSIKKWITLRYPIIFCENSNYESVKINSLLKDDSVQKFEYLKFTTKRSFLGKGHGEAEIIDFVFQNSELIKKHTTICKATGKNYVDNADLILAKMLMPPFCNNTVTTILKRNLTFADSRFFFFKKDFYYNYWYKFLEQVNEQGGNYFEHSLAKSVHLAMSEDKNWSMLPLLPVFEGYYGSDGTKYDNFIAKKLIKRFFYFILNKSISQ